MKHIIKQFNNSRKTENYNCEGQKIPRPVFYTVSLKQIRPSPGARGVATSVSQDTTVAVSKSAQTFTLQRTLNRVETISKNQRTFEGSKRKGELEKQDKNLFLG